MKSITTTDETQTRAFASEYLWPLSPGDIVALVGPMGAGKSVIARAVARLAGVDGRMPSPTFTLINEYDGQPPVRHIDLYRLASADEVLSLDIDETAPDWLTLCEWADRSPELLATATAVVRIELDPDRPEARLITLERR